MTVLLPGIGRNGIVNSVRKLVGTSIPGWKDVDSAAEFIAGQVAMMSASGLQVCTGGTAQPYGLFFCHKATSFYRAVKNEDATAPAVGGTINLAHAGVKAGSVRITSTGSTVTALVEDVAYSVNTTNGIITNLAMIEDDELYISYLYEDPTLSGIDQTLGSGKAAVLVDPAEVATLVYATEDDYVLGNPVYSDSDGYVTSADPGSGIVIGNITKVPTAEDPELYFTLRIASKA